MAKICFYKKAVYPWFKVEYKPRTTLTFYLTVYLTAYGAQ